MLKLEHVQTWFASDELHGRIVFSFGKEMNWGSSKEDANFRETETDFTCYFVPLHELVQEIEVGLLVMEGVILLWVAIEVEEDGLDHVVGPVDFLAEGTQTAFIVELVVVVAASAGLHGDLR